MNHRTWIRMAVCVRSVAAAFFGSGLFLGTALADAVSVNGSCEFGVCNPLPVLAEGGSVSNPFSFVYTFANSDRYEVTGTAGAINRSNANGIVEITSDDISIVFLGNNTATASGPDTLVINFLQDFQTPYSGNNHSGFENFSGRFIGPVAGTSTAEHQVFSNGGTAMLLLGPFSPPTPFSTGSTGQPFSQGPITEVDVRDTVLFGSGSGIGATIEINGESAPEPTSGLLVAGGVSGLFSFLAAKRRPHGGSKCLE